CSVDFVRTNAGRQRPQRKRRRSHHRADGRNGKDYASCFLSTSTILVQWLTPSSLATILPSCTTRKRGVPLLRGSWSRIGFRSPGQKRSWYASLSLGGSTSIHVTCRYSAEASHWALYLFFH